MEGWPSRKHKSTSLMLMIMILILMVQPIHGGCIEEERKALLEIKFSLINPYDSKDNHILPTWIDYGNECCDWERVKCNTTTGHVTELSLYNLKEIPESGINNMIQRIWPLNVSLFLHFEELTTLNLSNNFLDGGILNTELKRLSSLKKLEILDLSMNSNIDNGIIPSLSALTSLKTLNIRDTSMKGYFPINEFVALENLETLDVTGCRFNGTFQTQGYERAYILRNLKILNLGGNNFNENLISSLSGLSSLKALDLSRNQLHGTFPARDLAHLTNLEVLDLSHNEINSTSSTEDCKSLSRLERLESISFIDNFSLNKSIISCLSFLPSLKILNLGGCLYLENSFHIQELSSLRRLETLDLSNNVLESLTLISESSRNLPDLKVLILSNNLFNGTIPMEAFVPFHHLEVLDLSGNYFVGSIPSSIHSLSSLRAVSFANNNLNGSLLDHGLCELKNLRELDLSNNMFEGSLPQCFSHLSYLKLLDISSNQFSGMLPPSLIPNLTSLEYIDISHNKFEGSFSFSSFSNLAKLEVVRFINISGKFELETEGPIGWIPKFQLKVLVLSNCNTNKANRNIVPGFLHFQYKLQMLDLSHNSVEGQFPNWLIENNTRLELVNLRNNSFGGVISIPNLYRNPNMRWLDVSENLVHGTIPSDIQNTFPYMIYLNLSVNALNGGIPSSLGELSGLALLDLSDNELSGEVPKGLFSYLSFWKVIKLSKNKLHGQVLSGNLSLGNMGMLFLDNNCFTGKIGNLNMSKDDYDSLDLLDISNNFFSGMVPGWITNLSSLSQLVVRNNSLEGQFPCGTAPSFYLDISQNSFSGPISSCLNWETLFHLYVGSNRFTGSIPNFFRTSTNLLTLDLGHNNLSGPIPEFVGKLSNLKILILRENDFSGSIPTQLCQLSYLSLIDLSRNSLSGSIPGCLHNISKPSYIAFTQSRNPTYFQYPPYVYGSILHKESNFYGDNYAFQTQDEVHFTTKTLSLHYKGSILDYMSGLDLSCNKLTGEIPEELGLLTKIHALNLSHNQLIGSIPVQFSNLADIESLDLSSNRLTGKVPSELIRLNSLAVFNVSHNNLSGRLPEMKSQFGTFTKESYEENPLLCGPPLQKECSTQSLVTKSSSSEEEATEKWYDIDMACFYWSSSSTLVVYILGFVAIFYINPNWCRRRLDFVEEYMYACYHFLYHSVK